MAFIDLRGEASGAQVSVDRTGMARVEGLFDANQIGPLSLKGLTHPVPAFAQAPLKLTPT